MRSSKHLIDYININTPDGDLLIELHRGHLPNVESFQSINNNYALPYNVKHFHIQLNTDKKTFTYSHQKDHDYVLLNIVNGFFISKTYGVYNDLKHILFPINKKYIILNLQSNNPLLKLIANALLSHKIII